MILNAAIKKCCRKVWQPISRNMSDNVKGVTAEKIVPVTPNELVKNVVHVSNWNKKLLVFAGRYKSVAEIPDVLPFETVDKARNKVRIKVSNYMMLLTAVGCVVMVMSGKRAAERGESVSQMNLDWHQEYNEKANLEAAQASGTSK